MSATKRQAIAIVREQTFAPATEFADLQLDPLEALQVGQTLRALARDPKTPPGTRELFNRVGSQMWSSARLALQGGRR